MKKIIVPIDFSECSQEALQTAAELAKKVNAEIHLVHVYEKPLSGMTLQIEVDMAALRMVRERLEEEMELVLQSDLLKGLTVNKHLIADKRLWQVLTLPELNQSDLIVMGTHGTSGANEFFVGSNVQKVIQMADVPVLAIKEYLDVNAIKNIVFASNFFGEAEAGFERIRDFATQVNGTLHLLKVITPTNFEESQMSTKLMEDFAAKFELKNYTVNTCVDRSLERGILDYADHLHADIIALETHGRKGFAHMIHGSTAEDIANHSHRAVLTTRIEVPETEFGTIFPDNV
jgi:nucleotide-binding universal stress UspA family protein